MYHLNPTPGNSTSDFSGPTTAPKPLTADCLEALLQMQKTDPYFQESKDYYIKMSQTLEKVPHFGHSKILDIYIISRSS